MKVPYIFSEFSQPILCNENGINTLKENKKRDFTEDMSPNEIAEIISNRLIEMVKKQLFVKVDNLRTEKIIIEKS